MSMPKTDIVVIGVVRKVLFLRHCGLDPQSHMLKIVRDAGSGPA